MVDTITPVAAGIVGPNPGGHSSASSEGWALAESLGLPTLRTAADNQATPASLPNPPSRLAGHPRLAAALLNTPWLIQGRWMEALYAIADGGSVDLASLPGSARSEAWRKGILALERQPGTRLTGTRLTTVRDGIATIHVNGPIIRYADMFSEMSGAVSLDAISSDFHRALADQSVQGIMLYIDSPGGEASQIDEFAAMVAAARSAKPIHAYAGDLMASAAYWIGSAAQTITVSRTASLGSIGTVAIVPRRDAEGYIEVVSSQSPKKRLDPESEQGQAELQDHVDALTEIFIGAVAEYRGVSTETVAEDFGKGGILIGQHAVKAGLADGLGSYETAFRALVRESERKRKMEGNQAVAEDTRVESATEPRSEQINAEITEVNTADFRAMQDQLATLTRERDEAIRLRTEGERTALRARLTAKIRDEHWLGADADNLLIAEHLVATGGENGDLFAAFARSMAAAANVQAVAALTEPIGVAGIEEAQNVEQEVKIKVAALIAENPKLSADTAMAALFQADRDLEARYGEYAARANGKRR